MKKEVKKMEEMSNEIKFLCRNKIKTTKELFSYKDFIIDELKLEMKKRNSLRRKRQKTENAEERQKLCDEILVLSNKIEKLRREVVYCNNIEERTKRMENNIKETEEREYKDKNEKRKER